MSIFDQFNANPYIRTYAGAPINEAMQVAGALTQRAETNIANMDKMMLMADGMPTMGEADKAYKQQFMSDLNRQIEEISQAPEHGTAKVRRLATKTAMDPTFKTMQASAKASAKWQEEFAKDPSKYGDVAAWEFQQAQQAYENGGGAAGGATFRAPALYELMDVNKFFLDNGSKIAASQDGVAYSDGKFIHEHTGEQLSPERVQSILMGAASSNPQLMRQMGRQLQMENSMRTDGSSMDMAEYLGNQVAPYSGMFAYSKSTHKMKGAPKSGTGSGSGYGGADVWANQNGQDITFKTAEAPNNATQWLIEQGELENSTSKIDQQEALNRRASYRNAVDVYAGKENLDPIVKKVLKEANLDVLPKQEYVTVGSSMKDNAPIQELRQDTTALRERLKQEDPTLSDQQLDTYVEQVARALRPGVLTADIMDVYESSNAMVMDTKMEHTVNSLGLNPTQEKRLNDTFRIGLNGKDKIMVLNEDSMFEEMTGEDFRDDYDISSARIISHDTNGTGALAIEIKDEDGNAQYLTIQSDAENDGVFRALGNMYTAMANDPNLSQGERMHAAGKAINVVYPAIAQTAERAKMAIGTNFPLNFGQLNDHVTTAFGPITLQYTVDGELVALNNSGRNLFENNEEYRTLAEGVQNPNTMATLVTNYVRQGLAGS